MLFFLGGSIGNAVLLAMATSSGLAEGSLNPLHSGQASGFGDGFILLIIPVLAAMALSLALPALTSSERAEENEAEELEEASAEIQPVRRWIPNCSVPWHPECIEMATAD